MTRFSYLFIITRNYLKFFSFELYSFDSQQYHLSGDVFKNDHSAIPSLKGYSMYHMSRIFFSILLPVITVISIKTYADSPSGTLPCTVTEKLRGTPLADATICLEGTIICGSTDTSGNTLLSRCPVGFHQITISAEGYDTLVIPNVDIHSGRNTRMIIELEKSGAMQNLDNLRVRAKRLEVKKSDQFTSITRYSRYELENTAGTINDVNRVLHSSPSVVTSGSDFDNSMVVRGGHSRENIFIIDGIELDNISHFSDLSSSGGGFGFIDGSLLQSLDFYSGGIPASFPARMSAAVDMTMREGSYSNRDYQLQLNTSGIGLTAEGPFPGQRSSYLICLRYVDTRSVKDLVGMDGLPQLGDAQSKLTFKLNKNNTLNLTSLAAYDHYIENFSETGDYPSDYSFSTLQYASGLQWKHNGTSYKNRLLLSYSRRYEIITEKIRSFSGPIMLYDDWYYNNTPVERYEPPAPGDYVTNFRHYINAKEFYREVDNRSTVQLKNDFTLFPRADDQIKTGVHIARKRYSNDKSEEREWHSKYFYRDTTEDAPLDSMVRIFRVASIDTTVYDSTFGAHLSYIFEGGVFKATAGVRGDYFRMLRDYGISPRCAVSWNGSGIGTFGISGGLYYQEPSELSTHIMNFLTISNNYDVGNPPLSDIELQRSWQGVLSYEKQFANTHTLTIETYGKWYDREYALVRPYYYKYEKELDEAFQNGRNWRLSKPDGKKKAYGLEVFFQKKRQKGLYYAFGYSLSAVKNRYTDKKWYSDVEDVRNHGSFLLGVEFLRRHSISARMYFSEGRPYVSGVFDSENGGMVIDDDVPYYSERIKDPSFSVNLRYNFRFYPSFGTITGYVEAWNLLNYQPVVRREIGWQDYHDVTALGIIPFIGLTADF